MRGVAALFLLATGCQTGELIANEGATIDSGLSSYNYPTGVWGGGGANGQDDDQDGYSVLQGDCDDNNAAVHPGATIVIGDDVDNDCSGPHYASPWMQMTVSAGDQGSRQVDAVIGVTLYNGQNSDLCRWRYEVQGIAENGPGVIPDCQHCTSAVDLDFTQVTNITNPLTPFDCGADVDVTDPFSSAQQVAAYWFDLHGMVDLKTADDNGILLYNWNGTELHKLLAPYYTPTHVGAIPTKFLSGNPMVPGDGYETGSYVAVEPLGNDNLGPDLLGEYTVGVIYLLQLPI